jgi:hypothetical protein
VAARLEDWLRQHAPTEHKKILQRIRTLEGRKLKDTHFGVRMQGDGAFADHITALFALGCRKTGSLNLSHSIAFSGNALSPS